MLARATASAASLARSSASDSPFAASLPRPHYLPRRPPPEEPTTGYQPLTLLRAIWAVDAGLPLHQRALLTVLILLADNFTGVVGGERTHRRLAACVGCSVATIKRALEGLERSGLLQAARRFRGPDPKDELAKDYTVIPGPLLHLADAQREARRARYASGGGRPLPPRPRGATPRSGGAPPSSPGATLSASEDLPKDLRELRRAGAEPAAPPPPVAEAPELTPRVDVSQGGTEPAREPAPPPAPPPAPAPRAVAPDYSKEPSDPATAAVAQALFDFLQASPALRPIATREIARKAAAEKVIPRGMPTPIALKALGQLATKAAFAAAGGHPMANWSLGAAVGGYLEVVEWTAADEAPPKAPRPPKAPAPVETAADRQRTGELAAAAAQRLMADFERLSLTHRLRTTEAMPCPAR